MYKRASSSLVAVTVALALAAGAAVSFAQDDKHATGNATNYRSDTAYHDAGAPSGKVKLMQVISDKGFTNGELVSILPLLQDLRDARNECDARQSAIYSDLVLHKQDKTASDSRLKDCERGLSERQRSIWNTITDRVGSDKSNALRSLAEPTTEDTSKIVYTSVHLQKIDSMLVELDKMAAARIAANGGTPPDQSGVRVASVETVTTVTREAPAFNFMVTMPAAISERDLVDAIEDKIVANEIGNSEYSMFVPVHRDLTSSDITFLREGNLKVWW